MIEDSKHLSRQMRLLYEKMEILQNREKKNLKLQAEIKELSNYLDQVRIFMLRLSQGHVPLNILIEHLGHKVDENELRKELLELVTKEIGPIAKPDKIQIVKDLPKTRFGKIMRRILRKIAEGDTSNLGDTSTLLDPEVVESIKIGKL